MKESEIAIVIPLYNEESVIDHVLSELTGMFPQYSIIVVDDNSTDTSYQHVLNHSVYLLKHIINLGQGAALQTGIEYARELNCKIVITFDSDGQHDPKYIEPFIAPLQNNEADIILGSRFLGTTENMPLQKKYLLKASRVFTWMTTGILLTDSHNGFRAIHIGRFPNFEIIQNRMAHASEIINIIKELKMRYQEKACTIRYTEYTLKKGQSMWNSINIVLDYFLGNMMK